MSSNPNPQGKGLVQILSDVDYSRTKIKVPPKKIDQITAELFTSMFVLESEFSFKPVAGKDYYLYERNGTFHLSLIGPAEWTANLFGRFIGTCILEKDITWTIEMDKGALEDAGLNQFIHEKKRAFEKMVETAEKLGDILPVYRESLPYYQRIFASALAVSLGISMRLSGIKEMTYSEAKGFLENIR